MNKYKWFFILAGLALLSISAALLSYSGPGDRSSVPGNEVTVLVCDSTQYTGGPHIWRYRDWLGMSAPEGSAQALAWMAAYDNVDDPATPTCSSGRQGVWVWQLTQTNLSFPPATVSGSLTCNTPGLAGWCRNGSLAFSASEPIPGQQITAIEATRLGALCAINASDGNCSWNPPDGVGSISFWANSSFGDTSLLDSASWMLDSTPPLLSISVPSADGSNGWFRNAPTLSLSAGDALSGLGSATFSGGGATQTVSTDGVSTVSASASDNAGNTSTQNVIVKVDQTSPAIVFSRSGTQGSAGWYTSPASLTLGISDAASGIGSSYYSVDGGANISGGDGVILPFSDGSHTIYIRAWDVAGNSSMLATGVQVDTVPPSVSLSTPTPNGLNGWFIGSPSYSISASDATSGIASALFSNGQPTMTIGSDGVFNVNAIVKDKAGNTTQKNTIVKRDATPPSLSIPSVPDGLSGWYVTLPTLSLAASDPTSGVDSALFSNGKPTYIVTSQGVSTVSAQAADYAGNTTSATTSVSVDTVPPALSVVAPTADGLNGWYVSSPTFFLTASDATSGLASALFSDGKASKTITSDGVYNLSALASDKAGNTAPGAITVKRDTTPPSLSIPSAPDGLNGWYVTLPTISLTASDATSGLSLALFTNGKATTDITADGIYLLNAAAADNAGNTATASKTIQVDTTPPALYIPTAPDGLNGWYVTYPTLSLIASDATSGLTSALFSNGKTTTPIHADGSYNLSASAVDKAGNTASALKTIQVDTSAPALSLSIPYAPDGQNGWYVTKPTISLAASDATSGLFSAAFDSGGSSHTTADGMQAVSAIARDNAGNTSTVSQTLKVDTTPPTLTSSITSSGTNTLTDANDWYNTAVSISINVMDTTSGIGQTEYRLDNGNWYSGSGLSVSAEGEHAVEMRVTDNAGNITTATRSFKLDTTKPVSAFTSPPEGTEIKAAGTVSFIGASADALSGLAATEISLDGGATWLPLSSSNGAWFYFWDTLRIPDGTYTILVHADDKAGNRENTARVQVVVGNKPPKVEIQSSWWLWEAGYIKVQPRQISLRDVTVRIACQPNHPDVVLKYGGENFPSELKWDRKCGNGAFAAESGDYAVTITACDTFGHCAESVGVIKVPFIAPPVPIWTPTAAPTQTSIEPTRQKPTSTQQVIIQVMPVPVPVVPTPVPPMQGQSSPLWVWVLTAFALGFSFISLSDPRPRALHRLAQTIQKMEFPHDEPFNN